MIEAYEPNEQSVQLLQQNIEENRLDGVTVNQCALTNNEEPLFWMEGFGPCSQNQQFSTTGKKEHQVPAIRLPPLLKNRKWDVVKLDVAGAELNILRDVIAEQCLNKAGCWLIEFHHPLQEMDSVLKEFGRQGFVYSCKGDVYCFRKIFNNKL